MDYQCILEVLLTISIQIGRTPDHCDLLRLNSKDEKEVHCHESTAAGGSGRSIAIVDILLSYFYLSSYI